MENQENRSLIAPAPVYTRRWLGNHLLFSILIAIGTAVVALLISELASDRNYHKLISEGAMKLVTNSISYCFAVVLITNASLMLVELSVRKTVTYIQYVLITCSLCIFYLLLLAMAEKMPFMLAYVIVTAMTVALIALFIKGITHTSKAVMLTLGILVVEYAIVLTLLYVGSLALLIGSLLLFALIALAMYFTLKLKIENEELVLK